MLRALGDYPNVEAVADAQSAYASLSTGTVKLLVTNLDLRTKLEGLQLAYAVATPPFGTRALVYGDRVESWTVRELQRAGAFFEPRSRLVFALPSYAQGSLPVLDRRNPVVPDRRNNYRGGRRAADVPLVMSLF